MLVTSRISELATVLPSCLRDRGPSKETSVRHKKMVAEGYIGFQNMRPRVQVVNGTVVFVSNFSARRRSQFQDDT